MKKGDSARSAASAANVSGGGSSVRCGILKSSLLLHRFMLLATVLFSACVAAEALPAAAVGQQLPDPFYGRWLDQQQEAARKTYQLSSSDADNSQGETEYLDAIVSTDGLNGLIEPKKKPVQPRFTFFDSIKNRRRMNNNNNNGNNGDSEDRYYDKRDINGMSMSITHNLDILRRGLLRELSLRQREQDRRHQMENNKKFLNGIGRKRR